MIKGIEKYDYISFDIFDTLIKRNVSRSSDIFQIIENRYNNDSEKKIFDFKTNRIVSEAKARQHRKTGIEDITIYEIYKELEFYYSLDICKKLMDIELEVEIDYCQKNNDDKIVDLYNWAIMNKKVIIASDMYLPSKIIKKILKKSGINNYERLYVSSEIKKTKCTGNMYLQILKDLNISSKKICHIGDNFKSDYYIPFKLGIKSFLYKGKKCKVEGNLGVGVVNSIIHNSNIDKEFFYSFGFRFLGPLIFGFAKWLRKNIDRSKGIYFLSRDGKIVKQAFELLYPELGDYHYLLASRRALTVPTLWKTDNYKQFFTKMNLPKRIVLCKLLERFGIDSKLQKSMNDYDLNLHDEYCLDDLINSNEFDKMMSDYYHIIVNNSKDEYNGLIKYLKKEGFSNNSIIIDIGWFGSMQKALKELTNHQIEGYYLGIHERKKSQTPDMHGFLFEEGKNLKLDQDEYLFNSLLEFAFSTNHGSAKKYTNTGDVELYEYELPESEEKKLLDIQKGALDFIKIICNNNMSEDFDFSEIESIRKLKNLLLNPNCETAVKLGDLMIMDNGIEYIAKPNNFFYYLLHPSKFKKDFINSTWKIGFLKRVFLIPLPYYKIIIKMKKRVR